MSVVECETARFAADLAYADIPERVRHQAKRSILNIVGTALAGAGEPAAETALAVMSPFSGAGTASLLGRPERRDPMLASFFNAMSANIQDFDDNHPATIIHPAAPLTPPLFAHAEARGASGEDVIRAFVIGGEILCRLGNAMSPFHYVHGWHITSTCGLFGAAFGVGALLRLSPERFVHAASAAAMQTAGVVEGLGTAVKSVSVGNAARLGMLSALLAEQDFGGPTVPLSGERGVLNVYCDRPDEAALTEGLGSVWEIGKNTIKPYPCGVVLNPVIDAALEVANEPGFNPASVGKLTLRGHPLLRERTDRADVTLGRESQVSAHHAIAMAFARGRVGLDEFTDASVAQTVGARPVVEFIDDDAFEIESVEMIVTFLSGDRRIVRVAAAKGGASNPLTDAEIEAKVRSLAERARFAGEIDRLINELWRLDQAPDAGAVWSLGAGR